MCRLLKKRFACSAVTLLGMLKLAASGLVGNSGPNFPVDSFKIEQNAWQSDGYSSGPDIRDWNQEQYSNKDSNQPLQDESPRDWELATKPPPLVPGLHNQYCSPTLQHSTDRTICPYPCKYPKECPCFKYCINEMCVLIAWDYDLHRFPCVSDIELLEVIID